MPESPASTDASADTATAPVAHLDPQSYSVPGNRRAVAFQKFASHHLAGLVLDVGCGPQAIPLYLAGYPVTRICGIDPVLAPHPFEFRQGRAEAIPWPLGSFDRVVCATVLDHVDDPTAAVAEMWRVLKNTGLLLSWETVVPAGMAGADAHHRFRFLQSALFGTVGAYFEPQVMGWYREGLQAGCAECFGVWRPKRFRPRETNFGGERRLSSAADAAAIR